MEEFEFTRYVVPLRDRMFRYAQSLLLCADEAEDVTHDLLERLRTEGGRLGGVTGTMPRRRFLRDGRSA